MVWMDLYSVNKCLFYRIYWWLGVTDYQRKVTGYFTTAIGNLISMTRSIVIIIIAFFSGLFLGPIFNSKSDFVLKNSIGGDFVLINDVGVFDTKYLKNDLLMVYFGFTFCPDVCPTELVRLAKVKNALGPSSSKVKFLFITLDPERDNPKLVSEYARVFDSEFIGLTGSIEQIHKVAEQFGIFFRRVEGEGKEDYTIDHTSRILLLDSSGSVLGVFGFDSSEEDMLREIRKSF